MKTALTLLLTPILAAAPASHGAKKDFGTVTLGSEVYRFKPQTLTASSSTPMALYLKGQLIPIKGGKSLSFTFQLFRPGPLGGMMLGPRTGKGPKWIATIKSKVDVTYTTPLKEGANAVFTFSGPLIKSEGSQSTESTWQGQITAPFTAVP